VARRILQTGLSNQHVGGKTRFKYDPVAKLYRDMLAHAGYEVEQRRIDVVNNDDIGQYDALFFGVSPMNALSARWAYGGLYALKEAHRLGVPVVFFIDDWQSHLIKSAARTMLRDPKRMIKPMMEGARADYAWGVENIDSLIPAIQYIAEERWPTLVMPTYRDGDVSIFNKKIPAHKRMVGIDPTAFYTPYDTVIPADEDRERSWVFGILSDQRKWMSKVDEVREWPLAHKGGRASKADEGMPEPELVQMYADSWGVLSCPYWHAGSGWFRIRHEHAMGARSILYSEGELSFISDAFDVTIPEVEAMSDRHLRELADAQADAWYAQKLSKDEAADRLRQTIEEEIAEAK
jgi:hypothetical protein